MKISLNWIKQYISIPDTPDQLSEILTDLGLEVEGIEEVQSVPGGLDGLVVGEVLTCEKHPNADKLSLTTVNIGGDSPLQIVCGAPNVAAGEKVIVATVGTKLFPSGGDPFVIKKGKIRNEVSEGMLCAEDEIGMGSSHDGIILLPEDVSIGIPAATFYNVHSDFVYDIGLTPNRSDATSHIGVARDLAAYYRFHTKQAIELNLPESGNVLTSGQGEKVSVVIEDAEGCPRFSGISLSNIKVGPAPTWMQDHLRTIGVRPINNIVDITNYVLHEYGQPLHAYDQAKISDQGIVVKTLGQGAKFTTLDEKERSLSESDLMICDAQGKGLCMAGVFGGMVSGVTDSTTEIFLEAAHFNALRIRKTSTLHNLRTDAARCFEKGSDPNVTVDALSRAVSLMVTYANASVDSKLIDIYPNPISPRKIEVKLSHINRLMGATLNAEDLSDILGALSITIESVDGDDYVVSVPTDKADVTREADIIEEVLRIYGFNNIPIDDRITTSIRSIGEIQMPALKRNLAQLLVGDGYSEMMGLSLIPSKHYADFNRFQESFVYINNTSNIHLDVMRPEMMLSGLVSVAHNINRQQENIALYELGRSYQKSDDATKEQEFLTLWLSGQKGGNSWIRSEDTSNFYTLKKAVQRILKLLNVDSYQIRECDDDRFEYGLQYHRGEQIIATFGAVSRQAKNVLSIDSGVLYAELHLAVLLKMARKTKISFREIPKYPSSTRDLAVVLADSVSYQQIEGIILKFGGKLLQSVRLFDIYKNKEHLGEGLKSYATSLTFSDPDNSLKDKQIDKVMSKIIQELESKVGAKLR